MSSERTRGPSLSAKLAAAMIAVLAVVSTALFFHLSAREHDHLVAAKQHEADTIAELVANEIGPAIDFGDTDDVRAQIGRVRTNTDVVAVHVTMEGKDDPAASWERSPSRESAPAVHASHTVVARSGLTIARVDVGVSLERVQRAYVDTRWRILLLSLSLAVVTAALLLVIVRWQINVPLARLRDAARRLEKGEHGARAVVTSRDELGELADVFNRMGEAVAFRQERLEKEMELAQHIQTSLLPREWAVGGLELSAKMIPSTEVGGDYYDVLPVPGGCWLGIGDVAGHGLNAGLIMLMIQSGVSALVRSAPDASPAATLVALNEMLVDNVRSRLARDDHATLTLLRYERGGRVTFAGAHEDIVVLRANSAVAELVETPGPWVGAQRGIAPVVSESSIHLERGDLFVLFSDGLTEARNHRREMFGVERLCAALEQARAGPVDRIREAILGALQSWTTALGDDVTVLVARYTGDA